MAQTSRGRTSATADTMPIPRARTGAGRGVARWRAFATSEALTFPLLVGVVHWLIVQLAASLAFRYGTPNPVVSPPYRTMPPSLTGWAHVLVEPLRQWDGLWYKLVAETGYGGYGEHKAAFWPLFPWLMRAGHRLTGAAPEVAGYVVANVSFLGALVLLYRLVSHDFDRAVARRTLVTLAFFPTAFFFTAVYTESLFLALVVGALLAARLERWWLAGLVGALAALTRSYGVLLVIPFAVLILQQYRLDVRRWFPAVIAAALPVLGPAVFGWHLDRVQGNWRAFADVQEQWNRYESDPLTTLRCGFRGCYNLGSSDGAEWGWLRTLLDDPTSGTLTSHPLRLPAATSDTLELVCTLLFLALAVIGLRALPLYQSAYVIPGLVIPLYQPSSVHALMSMPRFGLTLFPLFVVLALLLRSRAVAVPAAIVSTVLLVALTAQFALWYWVS